MGEGARWQTRRSWMSAEGRCGRCWPSWSLDLTRLSQRNIAEAPRGSSQRQGPREPWKWGGCGTQRVLVRSVAPCDEAGDAEVALSLRDRSHELERAQKEGREKLFFVRQPTSHAGAPPPSFVYKTTLLHASSWKSKLCLLDGGSQLLRLPGSPHDRTKGVQLLARYRGGISSPGRDGMQRINYLISFVLVGCSPPARTLSPAKLRYTEDSWACASRTTIMLIQNLVCLTVK